jgi:cyclopropane-fatty-acyl-phospholipid synthase
MTVRALTDRAGQKGRPPTGASRAAIAHHYDVGNEFYRLWLDSTLTYSCALWEDGDDLESAQRRKMDFLVGLAAATGAQRVLDIGCGWGGMLARLVGSHEVQRAVGLTLSQPQADWIAGRSAGRIDVRVESWEQHETAEQYDAIISVGAFEHFATPGLSRRQKVDRYRSFFAKCHALLVPGGRLALQTIAVGDAKLTRDALADVIFIGREVFPESMLPRQSEITTACEPMFAVASVRNDQAHYALTCREWLRRLRANRQEAVDVGGEDLVERYERYLDAAARMFGQGHAHLLRLGLVRVQ